MFRKIGKNIFWGFFSKIITLALGLLIPRFLIISYGSEMNGLLSTVTQVFTYIALLEAGIGNATINALYKPLDSSDIEEANVVMSQAKYYYRRISYIYGLCVFLFAIIYPVTLSTTIDKLTIFLVVLLQGASGFITYYYTASYTQLLTADGKKYVVENLTLVFHILTSLSKIILVVFGFNVVFIQLSFLVLNLIKIPIIKYLVNVRYNWLLFTKTKERSRLKERGAFLIHEISSTIFSNTDIFLISTFCSLALSSVYAVYNLVFSTLNSMINTANAGLGFVLGQNYYKDRNRFLKIYDLYCSAYTSVVFIIITVAYILIEPFIKIYTNGIRDIDYIISGLGLLFAIINIMSGVRAVAARLITVSGNADVTKNRSILEMLINIIASIILVNIIGIHGVLWGTIIALCYRMNDIIIFANICILKRNPLKEYIYIGINALLFALFVIINIYIKINIDGYFAFLVNAIFWLLLCCVTYGTVFVAVNIRNIRLLLNVLFKKGTK